MFPQVTLVQPKKHSRVQIINLISQALVVLIEGGMHLFETGHSLGEGLVEFSEDEADTVVDLLPVQLVVVLLAVLLNAGLHIVHLTKLGQLPLVVLLQLPLLFLILPLDVGHQVDCVFLLDPDHHLLHLLGLDDWLLADEAVDRVVAPDGKLVCFALLGLARHINFKY